MKKSNNYKNNQSNNYKNNQTMAKKLSLRQRIRACESLSLDEKIEAINNLNKVKCVNTDLLIYRFVWSQTPQGKDYWARLSKLVDE